MIQQSIFTENPKEFKTKVKLNSPYDKEYCINQILKEEYLWDMRCWKKPRQKIDKQDVLDWINNDCNPNNCGHTRYCIQLLLANKWATKEEITKVALQNYKIKFPNEIGSWFKK